MPSIRQIFLGSMLLLASCGSPTTAENNGTTGGPNNGKGDDTGELVGEVLNESLRDVDFTQLGDTIAKAVLRSGDTLPTNYEDTVAKLERFDTEGCTEGPTKSMTTFVVSETAQILEQPTFYRTVTSRLCDDRQRHGLVFSAFGVTVDGPLPTAVEVIAFDDSAGVFNYYEVAGGEWSFFGDSNDIINGTAGRCANCHIGGGLVMKELDTPWLHWEGHTTTPGSIDLVRAHENTLGSRGASASTLEITVKRANIEWNRFRANTLVSSGDPKRILEPLFCSLEVNLDNGADFSNTTLSRIPGDFLFDPQLRGSGNGAVPMASAVYQQAITEAGQFVPGLEGVEKTDTFFAMVYPERSNIDDQYVETIVERGVIDQRFVKDVLMIDFTRPIFSDARCSLLEFAPTGEQLAATCCKNCSAGPACGDSCLSAGANCTQPEGCACGGENGAFTPNRIRQGFIDNLLAANPAEGTPAAALLANLQNAEDDPAHEMRLNTFLNACKARPQAEFMTDVMTMLSLYRRKARQLPMFEFEATMPDDMLSPDANHHLDPVTCELVR